MKKTRTALLVGILIAFCCRTAHAAATFTPLGDLPGGAFYSSAFGVSADGFVVVGHVSASGDQAFRWTSGGGMIGLGDLPGGALFESSAADVSADGSVIVGTGNGVHHQPGSEAFRWTSGGGMVGLGDLPGGNFYSFARGVSDDGSTVVGESRSALGVEAFRWTASGGMVGLGDLPGGVFESGSEDISADGSVIVGYGTSASGYEAFRWTSGGGMVGLGDLPGGVFESYGFGVSADGSVAFGQSSSASGIETFRWTPGGGMVGLGDLPGGALESDPWDISADGSVIVGIGNSALGAEAFRWTAGGGMQNLRELLIAGGATGLTGWTLTQASAMSADGRTIVGYGENHLGQTEAWISHLDLGPTLAGDFNEDGVVDAADFVVLRKGLGTTYTQNDYDIWRAHFGNATPIGVGSGAVGYGHRGCGPGASAEPLLTAVPEPPTTLLCLLTMIVRLFPRRVTV